MKLSRIITILALLALGACTKPDMDSPQEQPDVPAGDYRMTVSIDSDIATWEKGDRLSVFSYQSKIGDYTQYGNLSTTGKTAYFAGDVPENEGNLYFLYPVVESGNGGSVNLDLSVQSGKLDRKFNWLVAGHKDSKVPYVKDREVKPIMKSIPFLTEAILTFPDGVSGNVSDIKLSAHDLTVRGDYSIHYGEFKTSEKGDISIEGEHVVDENGKLTLYFYAFPEKFSVGVSLNATVGAVTYSAVAVPKGTYEAGRKNLVRINMRPPEENNSRYRIENGKFYLDGKEFFIKGVCYNGTNDLRGNNYDRLAVECGVNVVRTYSYPDLGRGEGNTVVINNRLKAMKDLGLYVDYGIPIDEIRSADFTKKEFYDQKLYWAKYYVDILSHNDNIIMWNIGNEVENGAAMGENMDACWELINEIAQYIKDNDPLHRPTTTTITGYWDKIYNDISAKCPALDFISINSYTPNVEKLRAELEKNPVFVNSGKPYAVTEYGPIGTWEASCPKTSWGAVIEGSSAEKAADFKRIHLEHLEANKDNRCIGGFAFLWGWQSHGLVPTYYAMIEEFENYALEQVDALAEAFGKTVDKKAPSIATYRDLTVNGKTADQSLIVGKGGSLSASVKAVSSTGVTLDYDWYIIEDKNMSKGENGLVSDGVIRSTDKDKGASIELTAPNVAGNYRLLVYARDNTNKKAALATFPFRVQ